MRHISGALSTSSISCFAWSARFSASAGSLCYREHIATTVSVCRYGLITSPVFGQKNTWTPCFLSITSKSGKTPISPGARASIRVTTCILLSHCSTVTGSPRAQRMRFPHIIGSWYLTGLYGSQLGYRPSCPLTSTIETPPSLVTMTSMFTALTVSLEHR